jgi:nucleoside phosphorylase
MPYSSESPEWRLLHDFAKSLAPFLARYQPSTRNWQDTTTSRQDEALERNLREAFLIRSERFHFEKQDFELFRLNLDQLCCLLNEAVNPVVTKVSGANRTYPYLSGLLNHLKQLGKVSLGLFNIVIGPGQNLFIFTDDTKTKCLAVARECNNLVAKALSRARKTEPVVPQRAKSDTWKDLKLRELASETFRLVFERFSCKANHRLLLELEAAKSRQLMSSELHMFLPVCSDNVGPWKSVQCTSGGYAHVLQCIPIQSTLTLGARQKDCQKQILDLCYELMSASGQNYKLQLFPQRGQLLSAWIPISSHDSSSHPILENSASQSLAERIASGMFKRQTVRDLIAKEPGSQCYPAQYTLKAKRALAVELGYCLLDFFDASLDPRDICFFGSLPNPSERDTFYRSFSSQFPSSPEFRLFRIGHPVLLSFAKILLELDDGEAIPLDIRPYYCEENTQVWLQLLSSLDILQERGAMLEDSYTEAIRGCLNVHSQLRCVETDGSQADILIRNKLYHHVVQHLETALENCTPNLGSKRQHSTSPEIKSIMDSMRKRTRTTVGNNADSMHVSNMPGELSKTHHELLRRQADRVKDIPLQSIAFSDAEAVSLMEKARPPIDRCGFKTAIICALPREFDAIRSLFDFTWHEHHQHYGKLKGDTNHYVNGRIGDIDVVVLLLSSMGKVSAATAATSLKHSYTELEVVFLAGVCGCIPEVGSTNDGKREILLGDVIVSSNMVQYDFGRRYQDSFVTKQPLHTARKLINSFLIHLRTDVFLNDLMERSAEVLQQVQQSNPKYQYPGSADDRLYEPTYQHQIDTLILCTCFTSPSLICQRCRGVSCDEAGCDEKFLVPRHRLQNKMLLEEQGRASEAQKPLIFLGRFGSGDTVLKSSHDRDGLAEQFGIEAFEMESAGLWEDLPCIVVKGVCDYADSHKNKGWQDFAAATSASVVKALLERYIISDK